MLHSKGAVLLMTLFILIFLTTFGAILVGLVYNRAIAVSLEIDRTKAIYLAEAGISKALYELKMGIDADGDGLGNIPPTRLGEGIYEVKHNPAYLTITSIGTVREVSRTVEIKYEGL